MSEWRETTLAELFTVDNAKLGSHSFEPTVMSLSKYRGFVRADDYFDKRIASKSLDGYKVVEPGEWAFSTIHIDEGSIARNNLGERGVISPMYTTMRWRDGNNVPEYAELLVRDPSMLAEYKARAQGSINRRRSLPFKAFAAIPVLLPSGPEQRRILAVAEALDGNIRATELEVIAAQRVLRSLLSNHYTAVDGVESAVVDLCTGVVGGIWGSPEGEAEVDVLALGPRIYTPGTTDFVTDGSPLRSFTRKQVASRLVQANDIILERSGGSPEQPVGRVVIAGAGLPSCVPTDFQRLVRPDADKVLPRYLFWRLQHDWNAGMTREYSRRTTGITNLSVKDYLARNIPAPGKDEQAGLVGIADAADAYIRALSHELSRLRHVRVSVVSALLSQQVSVAASLDTFLEQAIEAVA